MGRLGTGIAAAVVAAAAAAAAGPSLGAATEAPPADPTLVLVGTRPVAIDGSGFRTEERIRLVLRGPDGVVRRWSRASPDGEFSRRFPAVTIGGCDTLSISAKGDAGSRSMLPRRAPRGCPPP